MELDELHVDARAASHHRHRVAVAGVLPGVRGDLEGLADAAGGEDHGLGLEEHEVAARAPVGENAGDATVLTLASGEQIGGRALGEHLDASLVITVELLIFLLQGDDALLQGADHLETCAVADVGEARVLVAAEVALADLAFLGAVEQRSPGLQLPHAVRCLLRVQLGHAVVVEELAPAHGVAEVHLPTIVGVHVGHRCGDATLGHNRVGLAEQ